MKLLYKVVPAIFLICFFISKASLISGSSSLPLSYKDTCTPEKSGSFNYPENCNDLLSQHYQSTPLFRNLGNLQYAFSAPVYIDFVTHNGNHYAFMVNNWPGKLLRLDFGKSFYNIPVVTDLGTVNGTIPNNTEGLQVISNEGKWYVIVVGGDPVGGTASRIVKVDLGVDIENSSPEGTNWGNLGNLSYPHELVVFREGEEWYGFTVNTDNNSITRFHFSRSFENKPTAINLGNIGKLKGPTGIELVKEGDSWYAFITNYRSHTLTRLHFGSSLLNVPEGKNLGNIKGSFNSVWGIRILKICDAFIGYAINATGDHDLMLLDFGSNLDNVPGVMSYGGLGNLNFPHSISKFLDINGEFLAFIPNAGSHTLKYFRLPVRPAKPIASDVL